MADKNERKRPLEHTDPVMSMDEPTAKKQRKETEDGHVDVTCPVCEHLITKYDLVITCAAGKCKPRHWDCGKTCDGARCPANSCKCSFTRVNRYVTTLQTKILELCDMCLIAVSCKDCEHVAEPLPESSSQVPTLTVPLLRPCVKCAVKICWDHSITNAQDPVLGTPVIVCKNCEKDFKCITCLEQDASRGNRPRHLDMKKCEVCFKLYCVDHYHGVMRTSAAEVMCVCNACHRDIMNASK